MPEEDSPRPSDQPPEEPGVTGPTVLKPPARDDATSADSAAARRPTPLQPTLIDTKVATSHARSHPSNINGSGPPAVHVAAPTAIAGTERKRIAVSLDELKNLSPDTNPDVLARALHLLQAFVAEDASDRTAVLWGEQLQQDHADLVSATLAHSQADVLTRVTVHLNRMMEILGSIDLVAVAGTARDGGGLGKYLGMMSKKIDTPEELQSARVELDQLVKLMSAALDELLDLKGELEQSSHRIDQLGDEVEASALGAQFLSNYLQGKNEELSRRFLERSMGLTQTALQIRGSASMRDSQIEQPLRLISAIQNVALVMVPGWLGSIASLTVLAGRKPTPTEAGEMAFQLRKILEQMQT
jgi:hypothetical protein